MLNIIVVKKGNSTSTHFSMSHLSSKNHKVFALDYIKTCDTLMGCEKIKLLANRLKEQSKRKRDESDHIEAIVDCMASNIIFYA